MAPLTEGVIPSSWSKTVICPIPKSSTKDKRNPLDSRGISLIPSICKVYCSILNKRLSKWVENEHILSDCQYGFRRGRSTIDHLTSLTTIIECRKAQRKSTFAAFIDLRKAYDSIRRPMLWYKLRLSGVNGKLYNSIRALYADTTACIRLNNVHSEWFNVNSGLKQGCAMSPLLFNLYINDLCDYINITELGVSIGEEKVFMLMYADDLILLGENENDLQSLLDVLYKWCDNWNVQVNCEKSAVIHFRPHSKTQTTHSFTCGNNDINVLNSYKYLGLILTDSLNFELTVKSVAQSANRALGLLICKVKTNGGVPYECFVNFLIVLFGR